MKLSHWEYSDYLDVLLGRDVAGAVRGGGLHVGEGGGEDGILASSHGFLPGDLSGQTGGAGGDTGGVVLLEHGSSRLIGHLTGVTGLD